MKAEIFRAFVPEPYRAAGVNGVQGVLHHHADLLRQR